MLGITAPKRSETGAAADIYLGKIKVHVFGCQELLAKRGLGFVGRLGHSNTLISPSKSPPDQRKRSSSPHRHMYHSEKFQIV